MQRMTLILARLVPLAAVRGLLTALVVSVVVVAGARADEPVHVAVLSDGVALGQGPLAKLDAWPIQLSRMLGKGYLVSNFSRGSMSLSARSDRYAMTLPEWSKLREFQPSIVLVGLGASDAVDSSFKAGPHIADGLDAIIAGLKALPGNPKIYLCLPPPAAADWRRAGTYNVAIEEVLKVINAAGVRHDIPVIDTRTPVSGNDEHLVSGFLPDTQASQRIARAVAATLSGKEPDADVGPYRGTGPAGGLVPTTFVRAGANERALGGEGWQTKDGELRRIGSGVKGLLAPIDTGTGDFRMKATIRIDPSSKSVPRFGLDQNWLWMETTKGLVAAEGPLYRTKPVIIKAAGAAKRGEWFDVEIRRSGMDLEFVAGGEAIVTTLAPRQRFGLFIFDSNGADVALKDWIVEVEPSQAPSPISVPATKP
ncbi:MAG: hypothetical protein JNM94_04470 [Phycisphaerae bacterium]|nr:hypothetical protein [Phycisphaerae bacterium]